MTSSTPADSLSRNPREARKVAAASFVGTTIEYYDFVLYAAASALVFGPQFFPSDDPVVSQLLAFATFAVGFLTRPLGGIIAGHFGDRIGRKQILVISLVMMGAATVAVGLLPTYAQIGVAAPVILVILRLLQGLAVGAEWGGAALMAVEHAPPKWRALYGSAPQIGVPSGAVLANVVILLLSGVTGDAFTEWGWRIGFLASIVLIVVGLFIRTSLEESPLFEQASKRETVKVPLKEVARHYPGSVVLAACSNASSAAVAYMILTFILSYGTEEIGYTRNQVLMVVIVAGLVWIGMMAVMAALSDRLGRRKIMLFGTATQFGATLVFFPMFNSGNLLVAFVACALALGCNAAMYAPLPSMLSDLFPTNIRYSGTSLGFQLGAILGGSTAPFVATAIFTETGSSQLIGVYLAVLTAIGALAIFLAHTPLFTRRAADEDRHMLTESTAEKVQPTI